MPPSYIILQVRPFKGAWVLTTVGTLAKLRASVSDDGRHLLPVFPTRIRLEAST